jgi:hypothetical protein
MPVSPSECCMCLVLRAQRRSEGRQEAGGGRARRKLGGLRSALALVLAWLPLLNGSCAPLVAGRMRRVGEVMWPIPNCSRAAHQCGDSLRPVVNSDLRTPLHLAASEGRAKVVKFLLESGTRSPRARPCFVQLRCCAFRASPRAVACVVKSPAADSSVLTLRRVAPVAEQARTRRPWTGSVRRRCSTPSGCDCLHPCLRAIASHLPELLRVWSVQPLSPRSSLLCVVSVSAAQTRRGHCAAESGRRVPAAGKHFSLCSALLCSALPTPVAEPVLCVALRFIPSLLVACDWYSLVRLLRHRSSAVCCCAAVPGFGRLFALRRRRYDLPLFPPIPAFICAGCPRSDCCPCIAWDDRRSA